MPSWPVSLPQSPLLEGFQGEPPDRLLASEVDAGTPKVRQRFSAGHSAIHCQWKMSPAQFNAFRAWLAADLAGGSLTFTWPNPYVPESTLTVRFAPRNLPRWVPAGVRWMVSAEIWVLS